MLLRTCDTLVFILLRVLRRILGLLVIHLGLNLPSHLVAHIHLVIHLPLQMMHIHSIRVKIRLLINFVLDLSHHLLIL
jgi:hypothetical protein